jgi:hypothetical protein
VIEAFLGGPFLWCSWLPVYENMAEVKTYYKPTQYRGKRMIYASTDLAERKKQTVIAWVAISVFLLGFCAIIGLIS